MSDEDIPFSLMGIRRGPLSESDCSSFAVCSGDIKKAKKKKKSSENDQSTSQFRSFISFLFRPPDPKSEKKTVNQLIKKSGLTYYKCNL